MESAYTISRQDSKIKKQRPLPELNRHLDMLAVAVS